MMRRAIAAAAVLFLGISVILPASAFAVNRRAAVLRALDYLHARQFVDGGFGEKGRGSNEQLTAWSIVAVAAAGQNPNTWQRGSNDPVRYLSRHSSGWRLTTDFARTTLAAVAAGKSPHDFGGIDLIARITRDVHADGSGDRIGPAVNSHIWSMIALKAAGEPVTADEIRWLRGQQNGDGGWGWGQSVASDSNDTAAAVQALVAAGESPGSETIRRAVSYLRARQRPDAGFAYTGTVSDAPSTSWVIQALSAAGESVSGKAWRKGTSSPLTRLCAFQASSGALRYTASRVQNPLFTTVQAIPALAVRPFPIAFSRSFARAQSGAPILRPIRPARNSVVPRGAPVSIALKIEDASTGIVRSSVRVRVDGAARTVSLSGSTAQVQAGVLGSGSHTVAVEAEDKAGNTARIEDWHFAVGTTGRQSTGGGTNGAVVPIPPGAGGATTSTIDPGSAPTTSAPQDFTGAPSAGTTVDGGTAAGGENAEDKWADSVGVEPSGSARNTMAQDAGRYALLGFAFFVPTVGAVASITWIGKRRARKKRGKKQQAQQ